MILVPSDVRVWLAVARTDMRRGMNGLALQVQEALGRDPFVAVGDQHETATDMPVYARSLAKLLEPRSGSDRREIGCYNMQNFNAYQSRFKAWMARFKGVASKYVASYIWRPMI